MKVICQQNGGNTSVVQNLTCNEILEAMIKNNVTIIHSCWIIDLTRISYYNLVELNKLHHILS
jgi:hypothetical protein